MDKNQEDSPWNYFRKSNGAGTCIFSGCGKVIKAEGGSTSGLHCHLKSKHNINLVKRKNKASEDASSQSSVVEIKKQANKITNFFKKVVDMGLPAVISRLVAKDLLPFSKICTSYDLRDLLKSKGHQNIPRSPNTVRKIVLDYAKKSRKEVAEELAVLKSKGVKFNITLDEWSSKRNRKYMNVTINSRNEIWNLGLCRLVGRMPAEKCKSVLNAKLAQFGLSLDDTVAAGTDGASVMKKFGKLLGIIHQVCLAHGIHLAVVKCLYGKVFKYFL